MTRRTFTVSGRIIGEWQSGQRTDHLSDALGSVTAITSSSGSVSTTVRYRPYGSLLSTTGSPNLRPFSWIGMTGYRRNDNHAFSDTYVRARHYDSIIGAWTSVDQLWPREQPYTYVHSRPVRFIDPDGQASIDPQCHGCLGQRHYDNLQRALDRFCTAMRYGGAVRRCILDCARRTGISTSVPCFQAMCRSNYVIQCTSDGGCASTLDYVCPSQCQCAGTTVKIPENCGFTTPDCKYVHICCQYSPDAARRLCGCPYWVKTVGCADDRYISPVTTLFHELGHLCGDNCNRMENHDPLTEFAICTKMCLGIHNW